MATAIQCNLVINSVRSRVDGSLGLSIETPTLSNVEKVAFMENQGVNLIGYFKPLEDQTTELIKVEKSREGKTPSQRLRNTLYVLYNQEQPDLTFDAFYDQKMESLIEFVKTKLHEKEIR